MAEHAFAVEPAARSSDRKQGSGVRAGKGGVRPGVAVTDDSVLLGRTSAAGGWFVSDAFRLAGLRRSVPHLCGGVDDWPRVECAGCPRELVDLRGVGVARPIHRRMGGDPVV